MKDLYALCTMIINRHSQNFLLKIILLLYMNEIFRLATELYKVVNGIALEIMSHVFPLKHTVKYSSKNPFITRNVHTVRYGTEILALKPWHT